jgi:putative FmdB family regulatory protein
MPLYEYKCKTCESRFEVLQRVNADNKDLICPDCGAAEPTKVFSRFASIGNGKGYVCETGST